MKLSQLIIFVFVVLNVSSIGIVSYFLINDFEKTLGDQAIKQIEDDIQSKSKKLEIFFISNSDKVKLYAILPEIQGLTKFSEFNESFIFDKKEWFDLIRATFKEIIKTTSEIEEIRILDTNGAELLKIHHQGDDLTVFSEFLLEDNSNRDFFKNAKNLSENQVYISDIELDVHDGQIEIPYEKVIKFVTPIVDGTGNKMGLFVINYDVTALLSSLAQTSVGHLTIIDHNGQVIYSEDSSKIFGDQLQTGYNYFKENKSFLELLDTESMLYDDEIKLYKFWEKLPNPSDSEKYWIIIEEIPQNVIVEPIQNTILNSIYFVIVSMLSSIVITLFLSKHISKPIVCLVEKIKLTKGGNYDTQITINGSDEIVDVGKSFNDLTATLKVQKQMSNKYADDLNLQLNEVKFINDALDKSAYLIRTDLDGNIIYVNDRFCELSGYLRDELIGQNPRILKSGEHPPEFYKDLWDTITSGNVWYGDTKNKRKDDSTYWTRKIIIPKKDINGKIIEYLAIQTDITDEAEYKLHLVSTLQQENQKRLLENEFTKMISHDLRDPISVIYGNCEILKNTALSKNISDEQKEIIDSLYLGARNLNRQIDELLSIYKINSHKIKFKKSTFTAYLIVEQEILEYSSKSKENKISIFNDIDPLLRITSDESYVSQIIDNLISNALEFIPEDGGIVRISAKIHDDKVIFQIQDNGTGFSSEDQKNLFKKFYELDTTNRREHKPYEIRLVMCKGIVEALGGKIWVESHVGFGSTFFFSIPTKLN